MKVNNDITPFKAILNDMYAKDISKKIRSVYREKQRQGEYICSIPAYGYKKDKNKKNKLVIDNKVTNVVKKIFEMYANGLGSKLIAKYLNDNHYLSPKGYRKTGIVKDDNIEEYKWNPTTLCDMLKNEVYIGNTVQNKKSVISYKVKKVRKVDKQNQIRVENTHEAIIDKNIFDKVQLFHKNRAQNTARKYDYLFRGLLYCKHCRKKNANCIKSTSWSK